MLSCHGPHGAAALSLARQGSDKALHKHCARWIIKLELVRDLLLQYFGSRELFIVVFCLYVLLLMAPTWNYFTELWFSLDILRLLLVLFLLSFNNNWDVTFLNLLSRLRSIKRQDQWTYKPIMTLYKRCNWLQSRNSKLIAFYYFQYDIILTGVTYRITLELYRLNVLR